MKRFSAAALLLACLCATGHAMPEQPLYVRSYASNMHSLPYPNSPGGDSVYDAYNGLYRYYNSDSIFRTIAREGRSARAEDLLYYYYDDIVPYLSPALQQRELRKMRSAAHRYNSSILRSEARNFETFTIPADTNAGFTRRISAMQRLAQQMGRSGDRVMECWVYFEIFLFRRAQNDYVSVFQEAPQLLQKVGALSKEELPVRSSCYYYIGEAYYAFGDTERGIAYMRKALSDSTEIFADQSNFMARRMMARYYAKRQMLDSSDYYFLSMYNSRDNVRFRPLYDLYALGGIARNCMIRGEYGEAIVLLEEVTQALKAEPDHAYTAIALVALAQCYINVKMLDRVPETLHDVETYIRLAQQMPPQQAARFYSPPIAEIREAYYMQQYAYNGITGRMLRAVPYLDSARMALAQLNRHRSPLIILRGEQYHYHTEALLKDRLLQTYYRWQLLLVAVALITLVALIIIIPLYLNKRRAYRELAVRSRQWAEVRPAPLTAEGRVKLAENTVNTPPHRDDSEPDRIDLAIMERVEFLMHHQQVFLDPDLSLDKLADMMQVNRNYVQQALARTTGKPFATYVAELRVKETIRILSDAVSRSLTIEDLAIAAGFDTTANFRRAFKKFTGLSPKEFRDNVPKQ